MDKCRNGIGATFGYAPQVANTFPTGSIIPLNQVFSNDTRKECGPCRFGDFAFHLNLGTGEMTCCEAGRWVFDIKIDTTPAVNTVVSLIAGNGKSIPLSLYNGIDAGSVGLCLKKGDVVKLVVTGTVTVTLTPGTDINVPLVLVNVTKEA